MKPKTIQIKTLLLHRWGELMCEVLAEKKAVKPIGITADDMASQIQLMLDYLRNTDKIQFNKLLESAQHLEKCVYKNYSWK